MLPRPDWIDYCPYCGGNHDEADCPEKRKEIEQTWLEHHGIDGLFEDDPPEGWQRAHPGWRQRTRRWERRQP